LLVVIGWAVFFYAAVLLTAHVVTALIDPRTHLIPLEVVISVLIMTWAICVPIMYGAVLLITPLVMATIEVLDHEH